MVGFGAGRDAGAGADAAAAARAKAAREVCAASAAFAYCTHRRRRPSSRGAAHFVDWYLVLAIGEAASEDAVRRRYRQLALQLHPDKNKHPKAEVAFKIVSEAHACLTDEARRRGSFCAACHDRHAARWSKPPTPRAAAGTTKTNHHAPTAAAAAPPRSSKAPPSREVQRRMRDECRVIDGCLRANDAAAHARRRQSFPIFDPPDYPHVRPPPFGFGGAAELRRMSEVRLGRAAVDRQQAMNRRWCRDGGESPVYQIRTAATECTDRRAW